MMQQDLVERGLSRQEIQDLRNKRTGLAIFQLSWIMAFVCLSVVNLQLRNMAPSWPPPGVDQLNALIPTAVTLALIASSLLIRRGVKAIKAGETGRFLTNWRYAMALGTLFTLVMAFEWIAVPYSGQYSNVFRLMVGFHGVHALAIGVYLWRVYRNGQAGAYGTAHFWPVEGGAGLWHFVTIAWLLFYIVLYIV
jgi:cytochrome c oxidase subunit III